MSEKDLHYKKDLDFWHEGVSLTFRVSQALFSSHQIDTGTQRLLKTVLDFPFNEGSKILDLGCGYGPIGLTLAKRHPGSFVHMVDRDILAVDYARQNAILNGLDNCMAYGSLGYDDVTEHDFDLIISNIPGKAGETVVTALLEDARYYLKTGGTVAIVVVTPLEEFVSTVLNQPDIEVLHHSVYAGHVVFHYCFKSTPAYPAGASFENGVYDRASVELSLNDADITMITGYGLPEFDSLDYQTDLVIKALVEMASLPVRHVIVYNPGQGYLPVILWRLSKPEKITLVSRDLLSLKVTRVNLSENGCPGERMSMRSQTGWDLHQTTPEFSDSYVADFIVGVLRNDDGQEISAAEVKQAVVNLAVGGYILVAGGSTPITRLLKDMQKDKSVVLKKRRKHQGKSLAILQRR
ncbi:MAG: methyltransferase domain-containing protein [Anaerolineales bacterium]|nr:MAG: methyltransferase domain-containing protein [Anaerolineales bacterium]